MEALLFMSARQEGGGAAGGAAPPCDMFSSTASAPSLRQLRTRSLSLRHAIREPGRSSETIRGDQEELHPGLVNLQRPQEALRLGGLGSARVRSVCIVEALLFIGAP